MSSGGHFKSFFWTSRKVNVTRGRSYLLHTSLPTTDKSRDPLLISKPITEKEKGKIHETDRIIHTSLLQSGKGEETVLSKENESDTSDSSSDSSSLDESISEVKTISQPPIKRKTEPIDYQTPPKKKYKQFSFKISN